MSRHTSHIPVQMHGCELIRVSTAPATVIARHAAKEFYTAGCANAVVMALQHHSSERDVVNRGLTALRAMLLGGGFHGRASKPGLHLDPDFAEIIATTAHKVSLAVAAKDRDLSSAAVVLAMDIRSATAPSQKDPSLSHMGKRLIRRIRFGHKLSFYQSENTSNSSMYSATRFEHLFDGSSPKTSARRSSFATRELIRTRTNAERCSPRDTSRRAKGAHDFRNASRKKDGEEEQIKLNRRWRSVSANRPRRTGSLDDAVQTGKTHGRADRKPPLALTGSEVANLSRQPSNVFGTTSATPTRVVSMDNRVCGDTDRFRRHARSRMSVHEGAR
ncbi:hypothetical protein FGB62_11g234 [Gracilaria domingensis]|nr:hypothetical protein FGB62_11g234 [Gracilaria domingensis]